jgi:hypothetical protein
VSKKKEKGGRWKEEERHKNKKTKNTMLLPCTIEKYENSRCLLK